MKKDGVQLRFSPTDLVNFMRSEFITWMDRYALERPGEIEPDPDTEEQQIIQQKGLDHEREYLGALTAQARSIADLSGAREHFEQTLAAMRRGDEIIYQGYLEHGEFAGYPDFLVRVPRASELGGWSYEPWDTKLARRAKPYFAVQLCSYAEMLEAIQGVRPGFLRVVLGGGSEPLELRTDDFLYYYRSLKDGFLEQQRAFDPEQQPEIPPHADLGRWSGYVERELAARDDLALVAGIRTSQIHKLRAAGIATVAQLAAADDVSVPRFNDATLAKLRGQARLQIASRGREVPAFELLTPDQTAGPRGLSLLPPSCPADVYFDMEGFPLIDDGREYLFGACYHEGGNLRFRDWWAHSRAEEQGAFESFVRWVYGRWTENPGLHIYHYSHYEPHALRRLMGKYGVCEHEVDDLLRHEVFVDLYQIVRQAVMIGEPSYSLKYVEHLYRGRREGDVVSAVGSMVFYQRWLDAEEGNTPDTSTILKQIRGYNEEDCRSTADLAAWLRCRQQERGIAALGKIVPKVSEVEKQMGLNHARRHALAQEILHRAAGEMGEQRRVSELLGHLLEFHRREEKPIWWRRFDLEEKEEGELINDPECLSGLRRTERPPEIVKQSLCYEYQFDPHQETKVRVGERCLFSHDWKKGALVEELGLDSGLAVLKLGRRQPAPPDRLSIAPEDMTNGHLLAPAVERVVSRWNELGKLPGAIEDYLFRRRPRFLRNTSGPIIPPDRNALESAIEVVLDMRSTTLCIQGPPGSGKTYTAAGVIAALLRAGKRVGITSNSHRAINLLLAKTCKAAADAAVWVSAAKICREEEGMAGLPEGISRIESGGELFGSDDLPQVIGGTVFAFVHEAAEGVLDYLFVDEAGQVSVANLVAMSAAARNLVLLGDQMQLSQPVQGSHPGESGQSALEYLLQGHATVPPELGIFLSRTWRLHPSLCQFISGAVYEDRLGCKPHTAERVLELGEHPPEWLPRAAGLVYVPVEHEGKVYESEEEEERIASLVRDLMGLRLRACDGSVRPFRGDDILVVAPYNLQVRRLERRLPGVRVGTVDKFQGQQAAVVIFSMCASSGDSAPRGIEFLFSRNRLNVAISRAETLAVVAGNPSLVRTRCASIEQMRLVNMYCRAVAEGRQLGAQVVDRRYPSNTDQP